jgi:predicted FMN-binding regulatory protein PaiB
MYLPGHRLEGKTKLSQNRSAADRAGVVAGLGARATGSAAPSPT